MCSYRYFTFVWAFSQMLQCTTFFSVSKAFRYLVFSCVPLFNLFCYCASGCTGGFSSSCCSTIPCQLACDLDVWSWNWNWDLEESGTKYWLLTRFCEKKPSFFFKDNNFIPQFHGFCAKSYKKIGVRREDAHHINNDENECIGVRDKVA